MGTVMWGREIAGAYDQTVAERFAPDVLDPAVARLAELAGDGRALELAVGTGRVALPLSARGVPVHGIELSPHMVEQLHAKPGAERIEVTVGDMTSTRVPGPFSLVYLVFNTLQNVTTQDEQVAIFANAAAHLEPGGCFVVEVGVHSPTALASPPGGWVFERTPEHVGIDTVDDLDGQISSSHHWWQVDGALVHHSAPYRYVWPSEMDLMARLAGLLPESRHGGWQGEPFALDGSAWRNQVVVYRRPPT
jgi:SAM-dependent methyltransferase